ncbi:hypothetical protein [Cerasicoccus arenae]|uniref:Uncharacterized protein n=1 Tax=Cerasicoccus arenae TaxID=424488 RepID=A0A8J3GE93_9BACT|nr:hypothetical protein [Cerasicoccus arenae]MBK1860028.1 hypothetical protein [Cerasicoccus arenae]GHC12555.1 hypothetical protein GCM10007047_32390 [Cerasicoccus arenae]
MANTSTPTLEIANFICRFGETYRLLDLFNEVVSPAFFGNLSRKYDRTRYFIYQPKLIELEVHEGYPVIGLTGRFVKDTFLEREQIFDPVEGIIPDSQEMESAPSSIFLLILNVHRLMYVKETIGAPSINSFRSTIQSFLKKTHKSFTNRLYDENVYLRESEPNSPKVTKKQILSKYPWPSLEVVPLASEQSLEAFVSKYDLLKSLEIKLVEPNDEIDDEDFFDALRSRKDSIKSSNTVLRHSSSKGLDKAEAVEQLKAVVSQGNQKIKMDGTDSYGDKLSGNNESFKIKTALPLNDDGIEAAAKRMYLSFVGLVEHEIIKVPEPTDSAKAKIQAIKSRHLDGG